MVNFDFKELKDMDYLGRGLFSKVYKKDDNTAYKIYEKYIKTEWGKIKNPDLRINMLHYYLLMSRRKNIKGTDLLSDIVYIDNVKYGVVVKPYNGPTLFECNDLSLQRKGELSKVLVDKVKELHRHLIYPCDVRVHNAILEDGDIKLIDLDDEHTHALLYPSPLFYTLSMKSLCNATVDFLGRVGHYYTEDHIHDLLSRDKNYLSLTYKGIERHIDKRVNTERSFIFISDDTDLSKLKDNDSTYTNDLVYIVKEDTPQEALPGIVRKLQVYNLPLYDFIELDKIPKYKEVENIREAHIYQDNEYKLVYKK